MTDVRYPHDVVIPPCPALAQPEEQQTSWVKLMQRATMNGWRGRYFATSTMRGSTNATQWPLVSPPGDSTLKEKDSRCPA